MSLTALLADVARDRKQFVVYSQETAPDVGSQFAARNVTVSHESLPPAGPEPFVVVRDGEEFVGAIGVDHLREFIAPSVGDPWESSGSGEGEQSLFDILEGMAFASLSRRQLLATSREIEERVWRVNAGTLHASFQSLSVLEAQVPVYERLATERDVNLHLYAVPDGSDAAASLATTPRVTVHTTAHEDVERHWALAFDGGPSPEQACALVAEEFEPDRYRGHWTYDSDRVQQVVDALEATREPDS